MEDYQVEEDISSFLELALEQVAFSAAPLEESFYCLYSNLD